MLGDKQDYVSLTTLRAIGALCVVEYHISLLFYPAIPVSWNFTGFQLWPDYFFALSGFILTHVYGKNLRQTRVNGIYNYLVHRVARVYPLHLFMLAVLVGFELIKWLVAHHAAPDAVPWHAFSNSTSLKYIPTNLLLVQAWAVQSIDSWNIPAWSVSAEFACYLVFPWIVSSGIARSKIGALALIVFAAIGLSLIQYTQHTLCVTAKLGVPRAFFSFTLGCVLYEHRLSLLRAMRRVPPTLQQLLVLAAIVICYTVNVIEIAYIPLWVLLIATLTQEGTVVTRFLSIKPFVRLGDMSYSLYMVHIAILPVTDLAKYFAPGAMAAFLSLPPELIVTTVFAGTIGVSTLTYPYVENTGRRWLRRRLERKPRRN